MHAAPNKTVLKGTLRHFALAADGFGGDIEIEVIENASPDPDADFIKPEPGKTVHAFYAQPELPDVKQLIGRRVRVELTFLGGPSGSRVVVQALCAE